MFKIKNSVTIISCFQSNVPLISCSEIALPSQQLFENANSRPLSSRGHRVARADAAGRRCDEGTLDRP